MILVTGGAGYIGSHVVRLLSESGQRVVVYDNLSTGTPDALISGEKLVVGDLMDRGRLHEVFQQHAFSSVFHFAASTSVPESVRDPLKYYQNNFSTTINLLNACVRFSARNIIFSSTAAVYGVPLTGIATEDGDTRPINPYGTSKLACELALKDTAQAHPIKYVIFRYFNVAGADPLGRMGQHSPDAAHLIRMCCLAALGKVPAVHIFGTDYDTPDGTGIRDYIHVEDVASAHVLALDYLGKGNPSSLLNIGYGRGVSVREVVDMVRRVSGVSFPVINDLRRPGDSATMIANADRIKSSLNWVPRYDSLETIVRDAWLWELRKHNGLTAAQ
jgi:UDP-glucose 4-epimerase